MTDIATSPTRTPKEPALAPGLEDVLGDPFDDGVLTFEAIAANEDASRATSAVRAVCDASGVADELIPEGLGGRRSSATSLVTRLRPLFRRDLSLAVDLVAAPLSVVNAALAVGDDSQRADVARRIRSGERVGAVLSSAESLAPSGGIRVHRADAGWLADGETPLVVTADARLWALPARAAGGAEALVLCGTGRAAVDVAPWVETVGLRGTRFGVATVRSLPLDSPDVLHAEPGSLALGRARTETAALVAALAIGAVDTAVHLALPYAAGRRLYRGTVLDIPHARSLLADVHTDLLVADALAGRVVRELDAGRFDVVTASAAAYLVPHLLSEAMRALSVLFGSTFYARVEPYAVFETFVRDVGSLSLLGLGTPRSLEPCVAALDSSTDAAHARQLAREAAILIASDACTDLRRTGAAPATDEWLEAALVRLGTRLTGRKASLPETSIESAIADLTQCVESGSSITLERVPIFGR